MNKIFMTYMYLQKMCDPQKGWKALSKVHHEQIRHKNIAHLCHSLNVFTLKQMQAARLYSNSGSIVALRTPRSRPRFLWEFV